MRLISITRLEETRRLTRNGPNLLAFQQACILHSPDLMMKVCKWQEDPASELPETNKLSQLPPFLAPSYQTLYLISPSTVINSMLRKAVR